MDHFAVLELLIEDFNHDNTVITPDTTFEDLHMDSYDVVEFLIAVEKHFGIVIENEGASQIHTLQDVLDTMQLSRQEVI